MQGILTKAVRWDVLKNSYYEDKEYEHEIRKKLDSPEVGLFRSTYGFFFNVLMSLEYNAWNKRFENDSFFYLYFAFTHQYHHSINFRGFCCQIDPKTEMFIEEGKLVSNIIGTNCESFF